MGWGGDELYSQALPFDVAFVLELVEHEGDRTRKRERESLKNSGFAAGYVR